MQFRTKNHSLPVLGSFTLQAVNDKYFLCFTIMSSQSKLFQEQAESVTLLSSCEQNEQVNFVKDKEVHSGGSLCRSRKLCRLLCLFLLKLVPRDDFQLRQQIVQKGNRYHSNHYKVQSATAFWFTSAQHILYTVAIILRPCNLKSLCEVLRVCMTFY